MTRLLNIAGGDGTFFPNRAAAMSLHELIHDAFLYPQETKCVLQFCSSAEQKGTPQLEKIKERKLAESKMRTTLASSEQPFHDVQGDLWRDCNTEGGAPCCVV